MHAVIATAPLTVAGALRSWHLTPGVALAAGCAGAYAAGVLRLRGRGRSWPAARSLLFGTGVLLLAATTGGWLQAWSRALLWVYTTQLLMLLLVVPTLLMLGRPVTLLWTLRGSDRPPAALRLVGSPLLGPALIPVVTGTLLFTPLLDASMRHVALGWTVRLLVVAIGLLIALPLAGEDGTDALPLAFAAAAFIGLIELLVDAVPGMALRLRTHLLDPSWFGIGRHWGPSPLSDQQTAGAILWGAAELLDLPFLVLIVWQWIRADARQAAVVDAAIDAAHDARAARRQPARPAAGPALVEPDPERPGMDRPWWETEPGVFGERRSAELRRARRSSAEG